MGVGFSPALTLWMLSCVLCGVLGWLVGLGTRRLLAREQRKWLAVAQITRTSGSTTSVSTGNGDPQEEVVLAERVIEDPYEAAAELRRMLQATRAAGLTPNLALAQARRIVLHDLRVNGEL